MWLGRRRRQESSRCHGNHHDIPVSFFSPKSLFVGLQTSDLSVGEFVSRISMFIEPVLPVLNQCVPRQHVERKSRLSVGFHSAVANAKCFSF